MMTAVQTDVLPLAGRHAEMETLMAALHRARHSLHLVLVSGDDGAGKTRLLRAFAAEVAAFGVAHGYGAPDHGPAPLALWRAALGAVQVAGALPPLPEDHRLAALLATGALPDERDAARLPDAVAAWLGQTWPDPPVLLALDDLHHAPLPSLLLLDRLVREARRAPLLLLGAYNEAELARGTPGRRLLDGLVVHGATRLALGGLDPEALGELAASLTGAPLDPARLVALRRDTEGNPLAVLTALQPVPGDPAATGYGRVVAGRLARLSPAAREVLAWAAVAGREFDLDLLVLVAGADAALDALIEAERLRLVAPAGEVPGHYRFPQALVTTLLLRDLTADLRRGMHEHVASLLLPRAARRMDGPAEVARHLLAGHDQSPAGRLQAAEAARQAATAALDARADQMAVEWCERGLTALGDGDAGEDGAGARLRVDLLLALSEAQHRTGATDAAREACRAAITLAQRLQAGDLLARAALALGQLSASAGAVRDRLGEALEEALRLLPPEQSRLRVQVLARLAQEYSIIGRIYRARALANEAITTADRLGDSDLRAAALLASRAAAFSPDRLEQRLALASEIVRLAQATGDTHLLLDGLRFQLLDHLLRGDRTAVDWTLDEYERRSAPFGLSFHHWRVIIWRAMQAMATGSLEEAESLINAARELRRPSGDSDAGVIWAIQMVNLRRLQGRVPELVSILGPFEHDPQAPPLTRMAVGHLYLALGRVDEARALLDALARGRKPGAPPFAWLDQMPDKLALIAGLADLCSALDAREHADVLAAIAAPYADLCVYLAGGFAWDGAVARALGVLATVARDWRRAEEHFTRALAINRRAGLLPWATFTEVDWGAMYVLRGAPGDREKARSLLEPARNDAERLGLRAIAARAADLLEQLPPGDTTEATIAELTAQLAEELQRAYRDPLTGLANRAAWERRLDSLAGELAAGEVDAVLAMIDLDHLKAINTDYGYPTGDWALATFAAHLRDALGAEAFIARYGGDEFTALLPGPLAAAAARVRGLLATLHAENAARSDPTRPDVTLSAGLAAARPGDTVGTLIHRADQALYRAKDAGRDGMALAE